MIFHSVTFYESRFDQHHKVIRRWFPSKVAAVWFIEAAKLDKLHGYELKAHKLPGGLLNKQAVCEILEDWTKVH